MESGSPGGGSFCRGNLFLELSLKNNKGAFLSIYMFIDILDVTIVS